MKKDKKLTLLAYFSGVLFLWVAISVSIVLQNRAYLESDEIGFVRTGNILFKTFFIDRDFSSDVWKNSYDNYGVQNPRIGLYILGGINYFTESIAYYFSWEKTDIVIVSRCLNAFFASFAVLFIYLFLKKISGIKVAGIGIFLLLINPVFRSVTDALTPDIHMVCFLSLTLYLLLKFNESIRKNAHSYSQIIMLSLSMGFAVSTRLYGICIYFVFCLVCIENFKQQKDKQVFLDFFLCSFITLFVFFISNPFLYHNFLLGIEKMTTCHIYSLSAHPLIFHFSQIEFLFTYPYLLWRSEPFTIYLINKQTSIFLGDCMFVILVYVVVLKGIVSCIKRKKYLPVYMFVCSHLWICYPLVVLGGQSLAPKTFLAPALSVIFLFSLGCFNIKTVFPSLSEK